MAERGGAGHVRSGGASDEASASLSPSVAYAAASDGTGTDGTTGRTSTFGRRTHIIQILRDSKRPLSAGEVAAMVDVHLNTARFHLENLVEAGLASRSAERRTTPGRPRTLYAGTLPNQTHERAQGYRLLAEILTASVSARVADAPELMRSVGHSWGAHLTRTDADAGPLTDAEACERTVAKMDALWFAPEAPGDGHTEIVMHHCPFLSLARQLPDAVCSLHAGLVDGSLAELGSDLRTAELRPLDGPHTCRLRLARAPQGQDLPLRLTYDPARLGPGAVDAGGTEAEGGGVGPGSPVLP